MYTQGAGSVIQLSGNAADDISISWKSSNTKAAEVDERGIVTAAGYGRTTITAVTEDGRKAVYKITVRPHIIFLQPVTASVDGSVSLTKGSSKQLKVRVITAGKGADTRLSWTSSDPDIVKVNLKNGRITCLEAGSCVITASSKAEGIDGKAETAEFKVTVNPKN
jgi:uncharacterized protein YjdB